MKAPLTKEQRAEMRERFMLGEYTVEDVQDVFERLDSHELADEALAKIQRKLEIKESALQNVGGLYQKATQQAYTQAPVEQEGTTNSKEDPTLLKFELDLATAKLATARVCECLHLADDGCETPKCKPAESEGVFMYQVDCPHCTNGVVISDERARELLECLKRAEEALDTMPVQAMAIIGPPYTVTFSPSAFELIRAARAKEGATK